MPGAGAAPGASTAYYVPCDANVAFSFAIGGDVFPIDPRDLATVPAPDAPGMCVSGISGGGGLGDGSWLVGDVFLKNVDWPVPWFQMGLGRGQ